MAASPMTIDDKAIRELYEAHGFRGEVVRPADVGYDQARSVWNGMIDRRPSAIARCSGTADVVAAVRLARSRDAEIAIRGGAHGLPGFGTSDGGLVVDLSLMRATTTDPSTRRAWAQGGATWADYDRETQLFGLASTGGVVSTTGVGGLTLGGGIGWLTRPFGLACDSLMGAEVVTADGEVVHATGDDDLLWALKGGGGNFGVVTNFEFRIRPLGPIVLAGLVGYPADAAEDVYRFFREFAEHAPPELGLNCLLMVVPPLPAIPEALHGHDAIAVATLWAGDPGEGEEVVAPLRQYGPPAVDLISPMPYVAFQQMMDPLYPPGRPAYMKSGYLDDLGDEAIAALVSNGTPTGAPSNLIECIRLGGAMRDAGPSDSAFPVRDAKYCFNIVGAWDDPDDTATHVGWARRTFDALDPVARDGTYVNFLSETGADATRRAYTHETFRRLQAIKAKYDPDNVFHVNQNIAPVD